MSLKIEILKYRGHATSRPSSVLFGREGGTIGRSSDNRLVLPDECISRKHARISYEDGRYYLKDNSSNGTQIVNRDVYVQGDTTELMDGDILRIGDYELSVTIDFMDSGLSPRSTDAPAPNRVRGPDQPGNEYSRSASPDRVPPPPQQREPANIAKKQITIDDFFSDSDQEEKRFSTPAQEEPDFDIPELTPPSAQAFQQPPPVRKQEQEPVHEPVPPPRQEQTPKPISIQPSPPQPKAPPVQEKIPAGTAPPHKAPAPPVQDPALAFEATAQFEQLDPTPASIPLVHEPRTPEAPARETPSQISGESPEEVYRALFQHFLKGAKLDDPALLNSPDLPKIMEEIGSVFREMVQGLWTVLKGRMELKAEFRLAMTMVRPTNNNPLKLSPTVEDAVKQLMKRLHPSFMEPTAAVHEGFEDIMNHQIAMNAGIQASLTEAFERFNPDRLCEKMKNGLFGKKGKCWETYCESFGELKDQALDGIFGKAFIRAYEQQLEKLRTKKNDG